MAVCSNIPPVRMSADLCNGNLQGIGALVKGMKIEDVIARLENIRCNGKPTSCPDQLAQALKKIQAETA